MIKSIAFKPGHLDLIELSDVHSGDPGLIEAYQTGNVGMDFGLTIINQDTKRVLGVMNGIRIHPKCMEVCMVVSKDALEYPISFFKEVSFMLDKHIEALGLTRVQATIRVGHPHLVKWIEMLGFRLEGVLEKFGMDGDDYMLYARVI
jgi:hypothetical protein